MCIPVMYKRFQAIEDADERIEAFKKFNLNMEFRPWCFLRAIANQFCKENNETGKENTVRAFKALFESTGEYTIDGFSSWNVADDGYNSFMSIVDEPYGMKNESWSEYNHILAKILVDVGFKKADEMPEHVAAYIYNTYNQYWIIDN
jgi:hypothetical protein